VEDYILRLDISMYNPIRMYLINCLTDLFHDEGYPSLIQGLGFLQLMVQLPSCSHLEDDIDVDTIVEAAIHLDYVGMVQKDLDLYLTNELIRDFLLV